ncbi:transmembrane protease serine 9-like [Stegodyphus dumicola]|uniref:transmembrane protease serine 9-like n=1 Tax=Stegodyphus dumicola TaxID=202533 RepID=UPI0015AFB903|nr:transmembrane protease serine 9-like [Stegodyphus dumicola]
MAVNTWIIVLSCFTYLVESGPLNATRNSNEDSDDFEVKIINGREAEEKEFPWMVALHFNGKFICSASLISPSLVMTAAHCVEYENGVEPATDFFGIVGNIRHKGPETKIEFSEVISHPEYGAGTEYDIAILRIAEPLELSDSISPICLPKAGREFELEYAQAMGWGVTSTDSDKPSEILRTTSLGVQPKSLCQLFFAMMIIAITDRHECAVATSGTGVCFGDSGGPLVYEDAMTGKPVAIGVSSFGTVLGCGRPLVPNVYTATASYANWIAETAGDNSGICFV